MSTRTIERRSFTLRDVQLRGKTQDTAEFVGYASTTGGTGYDVRDFMGAYRERIKPGAFKRALAEQHDVPLMFNHDSMPIARFPGTMRLSEDKSGLRVEATLDRRQTLANDLCIALERGDLRQMSFAFMATRDNWSSDYSEREVEDLDLLDCSVVTHPANPGTSAGLADLSTVRARRIIADQRGGRVLSSANETLIKQALDAIKAADGALSTVLSSQGTNDAQAGASGNDNGDTNDEYGAAGAQGVAGSPGSQNPLMPTDGLGPRSAPPFGTTRALAAIAQARRAKYTAKQITALGRQGKAFDNGDGTFSFPVADREDLEHAISMVHLGGADHNAIRQWLRRRAKVMGLLHLIPPSWRPDGSLIIDKKARSDATIQRFRDAVYVDQVTSGRPVVIAPGYTPSNEARDAVKRAAATRKFVAKPRKSLKGCHLAERARLVARNAGRKP